MGLVVNQPEKFVDCRQAFERIKGFLEAAERGGSAIAPGGKLSITAKDGFLEVSDNGGFLAPR
jgi:hypothetical protein